LFFSEIPGSLGASQVEIDTSKYGLT